MASLTKTDLENFIAEVVKLRDVSYEQSIEHNGAIKAAQYLLQKMTDNEATKPKKVRRGRRGLPPPPEFPDQQREGE